MTNDPTDGGITEKKPEYASLPGKLPLGAKVVMVSKEFKERTEDGKVVCTVRQSVNPVRQNKKAMKRAGLSTKQIKRIEREARRLQREQEREIGEATSALSLAAIQKGAFSPVAAPEGEAA